MRADRILRDAASIAIATAIYAVSFGVLSVAAGLSVAQTCALSALTFTGASQFTFVSIVSAGGGYAAAIPPALVLAARNTIYALSLRSVVRGGRAQRALDAHLVIDESTAMAHAQADPPDKRRAFLTTGLLIFVFWNGGTAVGALAGGVLADPRDLGLDAIFPAVFLALLAPQLRRAGAVPAAVGGAVIALALLPISSAGVPVMVSVLAAVPVLFAVRRRR